LKKFRDDVTVITRLEACVNEPRSGGSNAELSRKLPLHGRAF